MSGATHSKDEVALLSMDSWSGHPNIYMRNEGIARVTIPAIFVFAAMAERIEAHLGRDMSGLASSTIGLQLAWEFAAGLHDAKLEETLLSDIDNET